MKISFDFVRMGGKFEGDEEGERKKEGVRKREGRKRRKREGGEGEKEKKRM